MSVRVLVLVPHQVISVVIAKVKDINNMNPRLSALKKKVVGKVSDALSAPSRGFFGIKRANADTDTGILKSARAVKNAPKFEPGVGPTQAFKLNSVADMIRSNRSKK